MNKRMTSLAFKAAIQQRLAAYREKSHLSQADLAAVLGISRERYSKWEYRSTIPAEFMPQVCARLKITAWFLLTGELVEDHMRLRAGEVAARPNPTRRREDMRPDHRSGRRQG